MNLTQPDKPMYAIEQADTQSPFVVVLQASDRTVTINAFFRQVEAEDAIARYMQARAVARQIARK